MWFSHLARLQSLELRQVKPGDWGTELELSLLPRTLRRLSVSSCPGGRVVIGVESFPCFAEALDLRLEANWIDLCSANFEGAGTGMQLHLACGTLYLGSTDAAESLEDLSHAAARCLLDWVQSFAADCVDVASIGDSDELMIHVHDEALTVVYPNCGKLATAVQAAATLASAQISPSVTCSVVSSQDRAPFLRFMVTR